MRYVVLTLLVLALFAPIAGISAYSSEMKNIKLVAELLPAPVGYSYTFSKPYPSRIIGYRTAGGYYTPYSAEIKDTGTLILVNDKPVISTVVHSEGSSSVKIVNPENQYEAYGIDIPDSSKDLIIYGGGYLYTSMYDLYIDQAPPSETNSEHTKVAVIFENRVDMRYNGTKILAITHPYSTITLTSKDGSKITMKLSDLIGVSDSCVAWFQNTKPEFPWTGGIVLSPSCTGNIDIVKTVTYDERPFATVFKVRSHYGLIEYVIMGEPTADVLVTAGILSPVSTNSKIHLVTDVNLKDTYLYLSSLPGGRVMKESVVKAEDATQELSNGKRVCTLPSDSNIVYRILWKSRTLKGTVYLEPGEFILFSYQGKYYYCSGALDWLTFGGVPLSKYPKYREITHPIYFYNNKDKPFLILLSNGEVYYGYKVTLPYSDYENNRVFIVTGTLVRRFSFTPTSIFLSSFFILGVLIVGVIGSMVVFSRGRESLEKIKIIMDIPYPKSMTVASEEVLHEVARKHIDTFGVCPTDIDVAYYHNVIPPIKPDVKPDETVLICPFKTNTRTEIILREINHVLYHSFWALKRVGRSHGYIYTILGEEMPYMYFYKQEDETKPEHVIVNAIVKASKIDIQTAFFLRSLGLFIVAEPEMAEKLREELKILEAETETPTEEYGVRSYSYNISGYMSIKGIQARVQVDKLQKFVNDNIKHIIIVSEDNITDLLEYLAKRYLALADIYYSKLKHGA